MYSREYFYSLRQLSNPINEDLKFKFQTIDTALFKEQFDNWRNNNRKSMLKKKELNDIDKIHTELNSYLNKLTDKTYDRLSTKIIKIYKDNDITLFLINSIFDKSVLQPFFCPVYVKILKLMEAENDTEISMALEEKITSYLDIIDEDSIRDNNELSYDEFCENNIKKKYKCGYSQFIGELYLNNLLDYQVILKNLQYFNENINKILSNNVIEHLEENIICLDKLLKTVQKSLDKSDRDKLIEYLNGFIKNDNLSKRFKFKLMDLRESI
jgi:hypothetical protein